MRTPVRCAARGCSCCCWRRSSACRRRASAAGAAAGRREGERALRAVARGRASGWRCRIDSLLADVYWIRAVQHYGGTKLVAAIRTSSYDLLYPLLDLTTSLDPQFNVAYRFGAIFLAEPPPGGPGPAGPGDRAAREGPAGAAAALGVRAGRSASSTTGGSATTRRRPTGSTRGAEIPGAPDWMAPLAAVTLAAGRQPRRRRGSCGSRSLAAAPTRTGSATQAQRRLQQLDAMDQIDALQRGSSQRYAAAQRVAGRRLGRPGARRLSARASASTPTALPYRLEAARRRLARPGRRR